MFETIRNLFARRIATKSTRRSGPFGKFAKLGVAKRMSSRRGISGKLARGAVTRKQAGMGLGALLGIAAVAAGAVGARKALTQRRSH